MRVDWIVSPGVSLKEPAIAQAIDSGVPVTGDIDIFSQVVEAPVVAITGSNGKSTVATMVAGICRQAGIDFGLGGNLEADDSRPALDLLDGAEHELFILELSSFQLETTGELGAEVAVILNLSEDHMDRYTDLQAYLHAKQRIFNGARNVVVNRDSRFSQPPAPVSGNTLQFSLREPTEGEFGIRQVGDEQWLAFGEKNLLAASELKVFGQHNIANALAAMAVGKALNIDFDSIVTGIRDFSGLPHRCQWVAQIDGVDYYNDSKGTNVGATVAAIEGLGCKTGR